MSSTAKFRVSIPIPLFRRTPELHTYLPLPTIATTSELRLPIASHDRPRHAKIPAHRTIIVIARAVSFQAQTRCSVCGDSSQVLCSVNETAVGNRDFLVARPKPMRGLIFRFLFLFSEKDQSRSLGGRERTVVWWAIVGLMYPRSVGILLQFFHRNLSDHLFLFFAILVIRLCVEHVLLSCLIS